MGLLCAMSGQGYSVFIPCSSTYCVPVGVLYTYCVPSTLADSPGDTSPMLTAKLKDQDERCKPDPGGSERRRAYHERQ